jgi:signal transduction histidine kinase
VHIKDFIQRERDTIMARWREQASHIASARGLEAPALLNLMPDYLGALAQGEGARQVERHLAARIRQGYQLAEIIDEFALLGRCIMERVADSSTLGRPGPLELEHLLEQLQRAIAHVAALFDEHMRRDEQREKRYLRLLREVATAAFHADSPSLESGLRGLLEIVMEAMAADGAVLLLRNPQGELEVAATAGAQLDGYATGLEADSLVGRVAASHYPTAIWDVSTTRLEVPSGMRESGIHGLLGVRLTSRNEVFGAMLIGVAQAREFATGEVRRLEALAEQLVAHLDTVMLLERLTTTIGELHTERGIREQFVAVLAHDLRGPLSAAKLGAELLIQMPAMADASRGIAARIERNLDRMDRMIRDLLDASRIRAGELLPLRLDTCDLGAIAYEVAEELRMQHGDRFVVRTDPRAIGVWSADELRRAIWNLASNAVKYGAPDRTITITVEQADGRVRIAVHNWGAPIAPEAREHLFVPFARNEPDGSRGGWGLGLTLVEGCARAHGGTASITSSETEGTTFLIDIPRDARPYQLAPANSSAPSPLIH